MFKLHPYSASSLLNYIHSCALCAWKAFVCSFWYRRDIYRLDIWNVIHLQQKLSVWKPVRQFTVFVDSKTFASFVVSMIQRPSSLANMFQPIQKFIPEIHFVWVVLCELRPEGNIRSLLRKMQLTQSRKLRQNAGLKIPKILAQRDKAAKYNEEEEN